jgi:hypothetical protein
VSYGTDQKRVSFVTREVSAGPKLFQLMQSNKAVRKAEFAIDSVVLALADVRVATVTMHDPGGSEGGAHRPEAEGYFEVTLVAAKASQGTHEPGAPDTWTK